MMAFVNRLGAAALEWLRRIGHAAFFAGSVMAAVPASLRRFGLVVQQIHAVGNLSLLIILASGTAVFRS